MRVIMKNFGKAKITKKIKVFSILRLINSYVLVFSKWFKLSATDTHQLIDKKDNLETLLSSVVTIFRLFHENLEKQRTLI